MKTAVHAAVGAFALALVALFLTSTLISELLLDAGAVTTVKTAILYGVCLLVPLMAITGGSGFALAKGRIGAVIDGKKRRMKVIAANGLLVMLPSAVFLWWKASAGTFDAAFFGVQAIEILGGITQFALLGLNFRDGLGMTARKRTLAKRASGR